MELTFLAEKCNGIPCDLGLVRLGNEVRCNVPVNWCSCIWSFCAVFRHQQGEECMYGSIPSCEGKVWGEVWFSEESFWGLKGQREGEVTLAA